MIIALNNKCHLTKEEFFLYQSNIKNLHLKGTKLILIPSVLHISSFSSSKISLGSQNVSSHEMGPYTGEISAKQLKSYHVDYCLVGHYERRVMFSETNREINRKIKNLIKEDIVPILCIGETKEEKENHLTRDVLLKEIKEAIAELPKEAVEKIIIAYEPIWSIGTGVIPSGEEIKRHIDCIKNVYPNNKVLYGGSVNLDNVEKLTLDNIVDGYLIGGLSLHLDKIQLLIDKIEK